MPDKIFGQNALKKPFQKPQKRTGEFLEQFRKIFVKSSKNKTQNLGKSKRTQGKWFRHRWNIAHPPKFKKRVLQPFCLILDPVRCQDCPCAARKTMPWKSSNTFGRLKDAFKNLSKFELFCLKELSLLRGGTSCREEGVGSAFPQREVGQPLVGRS